MAVSKYGVKINLKNKEKLTDTEQRVIDLEIERLKMVVNFRKEYFSKQIWLHVAIYGILSTLFFSGATYFKNLGYTEDKTTLYVGSLAIIILIGIIAISYSYKRLLDQIENNIYNYYKNYENLINNVQKGKIIYFQNSKSEPGKRTSQNLLIYILLSFLILIIILMLIKYIILPMIN